MKAWLDAPMNIHDFLLGILIGEAIFIVLVLMVGFVIGRRR